MRFPVAVWVVIFASPCWAERRIPYAYRVTDLGTLGGPESWATRISEQGHVVGASHFSDESIGYHAFLWFDGVMQDIGTLPPSGLSNAYGVNAHGQVVGSSGNCPFLWLPKPDYGLPAGMTLLGDCGFSGAARDINDAGQVTGGGRAAPYLWLPEPANGLSSGFHGFGGLRVNSAGQVLGLNTLWLPAPTFGMAAGLNVIWSSTCAPNDCTSFDDMNSHGLTLVTSVGVSETKLYLWDLSTEEFADLYLSGCPCGVNDANVVVTHAYWWFGGHGEFWRDTPLLTYWDKEQLREYVVASLVLSRYPWRLFSAVDINNRLEIAANGLDNDDLQHALLLTPIVLDLDEDHDTDDSEFSALVACLLGPAEPLPGSCTAVDFDVDGRVDLADVQALQVGFTGPN